LEETTVAIAEIKARGQLTIPKKIREISHIEEGNIVSILPIGDSLIITPRRLEIDEARRQLRRLVKASGLTVEELVDGLKEERTEVFEELYGAKKKM